MQVKSRVPLISIRTPVLNVSKGLGHAMKTVPRGCLPQGLGSHMDLNWALDTMFHTAALDPHFCPKHPPPHPAALPALINLGPLHFALFPVDGQESRGEGHLVSGPGFLGGLCLLPLPLAFLLL